MNVLYNDLEKKPLVKQWDKCEKDVEIILKDIIITNAQRFFM